MAKVRTPAEGERLPGETTQAFEAFSIYRDMGAGRTSAKVGKQLGKSATLMEGWSVRWNWVARAESWDAYVDREKRQQNLQAILDMNERHIRLALMVQNKLVAGLQSLQGEGLSARDLSTFMDMAIRVERLARGSATDRTEVSGTDGGPVVIRVRADDLSDDDLAAIAARGGLGDAKAPESTPETD